MPEEIQIVPMTLDLSRAISYEQLEYDLRRAAQAEGMAARMTQTYFSIILLQERWREACIWVDADTNRLYDNPYDAPKEIEHLVKTDTPRFATSTEWMEHMAKMPNFARSTCYARHREIVRQMKTLGRTFEAAVKSVMLSAGYGKLMIDVIANEKDGLFLPEQVIQIVPEPLREEALADIEERGAEACREIVLKKMRADETRLEEGEDPRSVIGDLRSTLIDAAKYRIVRHPRFPNAFVISVEEDGRRTDYLLSIEDIAHKPPPQSVINWLASRLRVF